MHDQCHDGTKQIFPTRATHRRERRSAAVLDCGVSTDLFDKRLSLFLNVNDLFNTVRTGGESVNPYNPSTSESVHTSRYVSFGLTWRLGRTEMEGQQTRDKKGSRHKGR
ncbi:MAG: outer membrane beta-barrel protein [Bacteroidales bacterium]|nr:outer membrane beta-barrel protein [Bacteroidales bacterium]